MKRIFAALLAACMLMTAAALAEGTPFAAEYEMAGTTSAGKPKNDTFIFEGMTDENGIITELNFDIIRNKGTDAAYSKKDIMGYMINVSDATVKKTDAGLALTGFTAYGYDEAFGEGSNAQFMVSASCENLTDETAFGELTFISAAAPDAPLDLLGCPALTFAPPDPAAFPCLGLAMEAKRTGGTACAILNGANEAAVGRFLRGEIGFNDIPRLVERALEATEVKWNPDLADILEADRNARCVVERR